MDLRNLRYFAAVVHHQGFARAAADAHATQPTLSKAVAQLEGELGVRLLDRGRRGVHLTQAGEILLAHAKAMLAQTRQIHAELNALQGLEHGELRLGLPPLGSHTLFAPMLAQYRKRYPDIDIMLREHGGRRLEQAMLAGELDIVATLSPISENLVHQPVCDEPMMALLPQTHPRAQSSRFDLAWLHESPLILFEQGFALNQMIRNACLQHGATPREIIHSAQVDFILAMVSAGTGIALLPRIALRERRLEDIVAMPLSSQELRWAMVLAWRRETQPPPAARAWLSLAAEFKHGVS